MITAPRIPPLAVMFANVLLAVAASALTLFLATNQPWMGIHWSAPQGQRGLQIEEIVPGSPADGVLREGMRIVSLGRGEDALALTPLDLLEEPDFLRHYDNFNAFLEKQNTLHELLVADTVQMQSARSKVITVRSAPSRPVSDLPFEFWLQLIIAVLCLGIGTSVWAFQRTRASEMFAATGFGFFMVGLTAAVYSTRELAVAAPLFRVLAAGNHAGGMLFAAAFIGVVWNYPKPLGRFPVPAASLMLFSLCWLLDTTQYLPGIDYGIRLPLVVGIAISIVMAGMQWRRVESPLDRAALRWFLFVWFSGSALFVGLMFLPILFGTLPLLPQSYSFGLLFLIYGGVALGVARYRLFSLERWWYPLLSGSAALVVVLILLPLIARVWPLSQVTTLLACFGLLGWIYFPLRNWFALRSDRWRRRRTAPILDQTMKLLFDPAGSSNSDTLWKSLLQRLFDPLEMLSVGEPLSRIEVTQDGSTMYIPATAQTDAYRLRWAERGARLFDESDINTARTLLPLIEPASDLRAAWESGARAERQRIRRDLEDDLAPRLYSQILRAPSNETAASARSALAEVRLVIDQLGTEDASLEETLAGWRAQIEDLCEIAAIPLRWEQPAALADFRLGPEWQANPLRILREALANAIDHANPTYMEVAVNLELPEITLSVEHDGLARAPSTWEKGRGMLNIEARAKQLSGDVEWSQSEPGKMTMQARLRLAPAQ